MWTYQEVVLASNPIIVSGCSHLSWTEFTLAMVYLATFMHSTTFAKWFNVLAGRIHYQAQSLPRAIIYDVRALTMYSDFVRTFIWAYHDMTSACILLLGIGWGLTLILGLSLAILFDLQSSAAPWIRNLEILFAIWACCMLLVSLLAAAIFWLPPNPTFAYDRTSELSTLLDGSPYDVLLNTICWRQAKDTKDFCFGILSILEPSESSGPLPPVLYSAETSAVYTALASVLLRTCDTLQVLALAAEARCPGASSWVPDFSKVLQPVSGTVQVPFQPRRFDPAYVIGRKVRVVEAVGPHQQSFSFGAQYRATVAAVSDFVDVEQLSPHLRQAGLLHNARRMMTVPYLDKEDCYFSTTSHLSIDKATWVSVFRAYMPHLARYHDDYARLAEYENLVIKAAQLRATEEELLGQIWSDDLMELHNKICLSFARSHSLFFMTGPERCSIDYGEGKWRQWAGHVRGQQQGQLQAGDEIVHVSGVATCLCVRPAEKVLVAKLDIKQSSFLRAQSTITRQVVVEID
jgi:hypothetical protein